MDAGLGLCCLFWSAWYHDLDWPLVSNNACVPVQREPRNIRVWSPKETRCLQAECLGTSELNSSYLLWTGSEASFWPVPEDHVSPLGRTTGAERRYFCSGRSPSKTGTAV